MLAVNSLSDFLIEYHALKQTLPGDWFRVSEEIRQDPDFIALSDTSLSMINEQGLWVESVQTSPITHGAVGTRRTRRCAPDFYSDP